MNQSSRFTETESVNGVLTGLERQVGDATREDSKTCDFTQPGDAMNSQLDQKVNLQSTGKDTQIWMRFEGGKKGYKRRANSSRIDQKTT